MESENNNIFIQEEETPEVTLTYKLTENDLYIFQKDHNNSNKMFYVTIVIFSFIISAVILRVIDSITSHITSPFTINIFFRIIILTGIIFLSIFSFTRGIKKSSKKQYEQDKSLQKECICKIYKDKLTYNSETGFSNIKFDEFYNHLETKNAFYVYLSLNKAYIMPKKYFGSNSDIEKARELFSKIPKPKKKKPVSMYILIFLIAITIFIFIMGLIAGFFLTDGSQDTTTEELLNIIAKHLL